MIDSIFSLSQNYIGAEGASRIAQALTVNQTIHTIEYKSFFFSSLTIYFSLNNNYIGAEGAARIAQALTVNKTIQVIW